MVKDRLSRQNVVSVALLSRLVISARGFCRLKKKKKKKKKEVGGTAAFTAVIYACEHSVTELFAKPLTLNFLAAVVHTLNTKTYPSKRSKDNCTAIFFSFPSYISGVHHFWVRFLRM